MEKAFNAIRNKMKNEGLSEELITDFLSKVQRVIDGETGIVNWDHVHDLIPTEDEISLELIRNQYKEIHPEVLSKLVVIKLNGGLGTSMGLSKAKSLAVIKGAHSFLSVIVEQIRYFRKTYQISIPLLFMDSYNTYQDCQDELKQLGFEQKLPSSFLQNKVPRILKENYEPISIPNNSKEEWCPPGHGDIYLSLKSSGLLDKLLGLGYQYAFLSNGDNLGATIEPHILEYLYSNQIDFAMEMTPKTLADKKGGAIYRKIVDGKLLGYELLETAQVPPEHENEFSGLGTFRTFSTNNLWINLVALKTHIEEGKMRLSLIVNPKVIDGKEVLQLETAMGSAVGNFSKFKGIIIPRERFAPVKKCEDLLIRRSDSYIFNEDFSLSMSPLRKAKGLSENLISLDDRYYKKLPEFEKLFIVYPSLVECSSLKVEGPVEFDTFVKLIGDITIINKSTQVKKISSLNLRMIENKVIDLT